MLIHSKSILRQSRHRRTTTAFLLSSLGNFGSLTTTHHYLNNQRLTTMTGGASVDAVVVNTTASASAPKDHKTMDNIHDDPGFYVIHREHGTVSSDLPVWASHQQNPFGLLFATNVDAIHGDDDDDDDEKTTINAATYHDTCTIASSQGVPVERRDISGVPGTFQMLNVLSQEEVRRMVDQFETLGFTHDAAVSLPRSIRHNSNLNWLADDTTLDIIWDRCKDLFVAATDDDDDDEEERYFLGRKPIGLNGKFRVYKYEENDFFKLHTDGSWPGSRVVDGKMVQDAFPGTAWSMYSFLIFLTEDFQGGATEFLVNKLDPSQPARNMDEAERIGVRTPAGGVLVFPHGEHPLHCLHSGAAIQEGVKYIIRTEVLFEL